MPFYKDHIYPHLVSMLGDPKPIREVRRRIIPLAQGKVLEIGVGPGINFPHYVSTFTLCTIPGVAEAIRGIERVLKPGGKLIFFELGMAPDPQVRRWQEWWEPIYHRIFEGLSLTRDIPSLITQGGFQIEQMEAGYLAAFPKSCAYCWWGTAIPVRGGCDQPTNL